MWLMTPRCFVSVVQKPEDVADDMLTVRARTRGDLEALADLLPGTVPVAGEGSDYPWRLLRVSRADWSRACVAMVAEIDYSNVKQRVTEVQGEERARVFGNVWWSLLELEDTP